MSFDKKAALEARRPELFHKKIKSLEQKIGTIPYLSYLLNVKEPDLTSKIAIQIPAFCDPELIPTIQSALAKAANPSRLHFCICLQDNDPDRVKFVMGLPNCKYIQIQPEEAPGLCAARNICQQMVDDEQYSFHIDSHMRFADFWDAALIACLKENPVKKSVISGYPISLTEKMRTADIYDTAFTSGTAVHYCFLATALDFHELSMTYRCQFAYKPSQHNSESAFISGGCLFGPSEFDKEVLNDPDMYHMSDECSYAARLWTHGWRIFAPHIECIYHLYHRQNTYPEIPIFTKEPALSSTGCSKRTSEQVHNQILFGEFGSPEYLGIYGPGKEHTIQEFMNFAGIDYYNRVVRVFNRKGDYTGYHTTEDLAICTESKK